MYSQKIYDIAANAYNVWRNQSLQLGNGSLNGAYTRKDKSTTAYEKPWLK